jgi:DNA-directed RNA polymerase specialized sigma24 family protein
MTIARFLIPAARPETGTARLAAIDRERSTMERLSTRGTKARPRPPLRPTTEEEPMHTLTRQPICESWPAFLALLDNDPTRAFGLFYEYTWDLLRQRPPCAYRRERSDWEDVISETILHCWKDDQRVLRTYPNRDQPFSQWLVALAGWKGTDEVRRRQRLERKQAHDPRQRILNGIASPAPHPEACLAGLDLSEALSACLDRMADRCRMLVAASAAGYKPADLTRLLGYPAGWRTNVAKQLYRCRNRLEALLEEQWKI